MKKLIVAAMLMAISVCAFAQQEKGSFMIQPKAGLNLSFLTRNGIRPGIAAGVEGTYQITEPIGVSLGALFSMQGSNLTSEDDAVYDIDVMASDAHMTMGYVNFPLTLHYYIVKSLAVRAGFQIGINIYDRFKYDWLKYTSKAGVRSVDYSIPVGLSYEAGRIVLDARYNIGINDIKYLDKASYNNVIQLTIGYKFGIAHWN